MIQRILIVLLCTITSSTFMNGQVKIPSLSPKVQVIQEFGLSEMTFNFHAPSVRGRTIFGPDGVIAYGDYWRTGANSATKITLQADTYVMDNLLPKGAYSILTIPNEQEWTIHWYTYNSSSWSKYKDQTPVASIKVKPEKLNYVQESLQIGLEGMTIDDAILFITWSDIKLSLPLHLDIHNKIMKNIENATAGTTANEYFQSALYLHESNIELERALGYIREVTKTSKGRFFHHYREALILKDLKRNEEAKQSALISKKQAIKAGNADFARLCDALLEVL